VPSKTFRDYGLAAVAAASSIALTRLAWPLFAPTPYVPVFAAVAAATHWGSGGAGLFALALSVVGALLTFPTIGPYPWHPKTAVVFVIASFIGNRLIDGRNRTAAALRASEAELRATLDEMRASEEKVRIAQRMEAAGQLAAGVAHNFNNMLTVTMVYTDVMLESLADEQVQRTAIQEIRKATERGASLTRQLLAFGGKHDPQPVRVHVDRRVDAMRGMLRRLVRENVKLTFDLGWESAVVLIDPHDLEQVVLNLVMNARDALSAAGTIHVGVSRQSISADDARLGVAADPGDYVRLLVRDDGIGMTPEVQSHLFEPFFTTKGQGQGTGVGLAFVQEVARHAGGFVSVASAPWRGTSVSVYLAAAAPETAAPVEEPAAPTGVPRAATILLVDDEDTVRETTAWFLRRAGHRVLPAASPVEAIALFGMYPREVDLLIADIVMPEMQGAVLAAQLRAKAPRLPVLFVSAYPDARPPREDTSPMGFLAKPFSATGLLAAIAELLE
jgi:two-component system cell cycle sensor histidine kinase/response regulator CckA